MKFALTLLLATLAACSATQSGTKHFQVAGDGSKSGKAQCSDTCDADVTCTPDGHCVITCTNDAGDTCEIELACDGQGGCEVVRTDCSGSSCSAAQTANKVK